MARSKDEIMRDLRLANFNMDPLRERIAFLLELLELDKNRDDFPKLIEDIAVHVSERLVDRDEISKEIRAIDMEEVVKRADAIEQLFEECEKYSELLDRKTFDAFEEIQGKISDGLANTRHTLEVKFGIATLEEIRSQSEQIAWDGDGWFKNANQVLNVRHDVLVKPENKRKLVNEHEYKKKEQEFEEKWCVQEDARNLNSEIKAIVQNIRDRIRERIIQNL